MAPSTALLFVLFGSAILLRLYLHRSHCAWWASTLMVSACCSIAFILFALSFQGKHPELEHLGIAISGSVGTAPLGHISPVTALCFVIAALSFLVSASFSRISLRRAIAAWWLALLLIVANLVFLLAYLYGSPLLYGGEFIPPAFTTITAFLSLGIALLILSEPGSGAPHILNGTEKSATRLLIVLFVILAGGILFAGNLYFRQFEQKYRVESEKKLSAIADLKVAELILWRRDRLGDGNAIHGNPAFSSLVRRHFADPADREAERELQGWINRIQAAYQYDRVFLLDARNVDRISSSPVREPVSPYLAHNASLALGSGKVIFLDFHRPGADGPIYLALLVPIFNGTQGKRPLGVLVLRIDPGKYLYPFVSRWPVPSMSSETLLVRREGDEVVYLNELRFDKSAPLSLRLPLAHPELPAAKAVLGREDVVEGRDYRDVPVVAALRQVPGSPWFLVAKMDAAEIYAPLRERLWFVIALVAALLISSTAAVGLIWRQQSTAFYKERFRAEQKRLESEQKYRTLFETMTEGVAMHEMVYDGPAPVDYRILTVNPAYERHTGIAMGKAEGALASVLYGTGAPPFFKEYEHVARTGEPMTFETFSPTMRKHFHIVANSPGPGLFATVFEDITERKRQEEELREKNLELESLNYTVSHDLKSPLVTVKTFLGYLAQDMANGDSVRIEQDMMYMRTASERMGLLLEDLFNLSRLGRTSFPPVDVPFRDLAQEAIDLVAGRISQRGVQVVLADSRVMLHGDRRRLLQLWQNLIDNAVKYMGDQAAPRVEVGVESGPAEETVFFVKDNGQGIDPRYREKIFGLFEQLDPGVEGTGIGLALVKRIVELNGGALWMESEGPGKGSAFFFTLPDAMKNT